MEYREFDDLPNHIKVWLRETGQPNPEMWVKESIPALSNRSILEVASDADGDRRLAHYCFRVKTGFP